MNTAIRFPLACLLVALTVAVGVVAYRNYSDVAASHVPISQERIKPEGVEHLPLVPIAETGFESLFNGHDLTGWTGDTSKYDAEDGVLTYNGPGRANISTIRDFSNFQLRFDYKVTADADNGIGFRAPSMADTKVVVLEVQLQDESAAKFRSQPPAKKNGACGMAAAKQGFQKALGEWNSEEIVVRGKHATVILNGTTILDADFEQDSAGKTLDFEKFPALKRERGHIVLLGATPRVDFRNLRIRDLGAVEEPLPP